MKDDLIFGDKIIVFSYAYPKKIRGIFLHYIDEFVRDLDWRGRRCRIVFPDSKTMYGYSIRIVHAVELMRGWKDEN